MWFRVLSPDGDGGGGGGDAAAEVAAKAVADKAVADKAAADQVTADAAAKALADKGGDGKGGAANKWKDGNVVPDKYELVLPDDSTMGQADLDALAAFAKENGLTQNQAANLLKSRDAATKAGATAQTEAIKQAVTKWDGEVRADKTMGATYEDTARIAGVGFDALFPNTTNPNEIDPVTKQPKVIESEIRTFLRTTGLGSHPEIVRAMFRFGSQVGEDKHRQGGGAEKPKKRSSAGQMYPDLPSKDA